MVSTTAYVIRKSTIEDEPELRRLAELDSQRPISGPVLIGEIGGRASAAVSLDDGRIIADPFQATPSLTAVLSLRYRSLRAFARTPSLPERLRAALRPVAAAKAS